MIGTALVLASALATAAPAEAPKTVEGIYELRMHETASALKLEAGGRFQWYFSQGAADLGAEGRWTRSGHKILLTSDPAVVAPRFTLSSQAKEEGDGLLITIEHGGGEPPRDLQAIAEFADGSSDSAWIDDSGEHRIEASAQREIVSVRLGSDVFGFWSEPFRVERSKANLLRFRYEPNDIGKENFQSLPLTIAPGAVTMKWRGTDLKYEVAD